MPKELIEVWRKYGFGSLLNGYLKIVNPEDYKEVLVESYIQTEDLLDKQEKKQRCGGQRRKNLYCDYLRNAETLSKTVLTNGVWIWAIRIVM